MATFICLLRFTDQGAKTCTDSPPRVAAAKELLRKLGGEMKAFYATMGQYDGVVIAEAPNPTEMSKFCYKVAQVGAVTTETLVAFTEEEHRKVLGAPDKI
jgi:uncharacterized protein with GYD domain